MFWLFTFGVSGKRTCCEWGGVQYYLLGDSFHTKVAQNPLQGLTREFHITKCKNKGDVDVLFMMALLEEDEKQKFDALFEEYHRPLLLYARSIVKSESLAEDAVQEMFLRVLKNLHKIDLNECSKTKYFLVTILRNVAINIYNKQIKPYDEDLDSIANQPKEGHLDPTWEDFDSRALVNDMKRWIGSLNEEERLLLQCRLYDELTYDEIESLYGIKASTASSKICRARNKLLEMYKKERGERDG